MTWLVHHPERNIIRAQLKQNVVLAALDEADRIEFEEMLEVVDVGRGEFLLHQGVYAMEQYFVLDGLLKRVVSNADAKEMILRFADAGDFETSYAAWRVCRCRRGPPSSSAGRRWPRPSSSPSCGA